MTIKKHWFGGASGPYGGEDRSGEERSGAYRVLVGKPEGKKATWKSLRRWKDNIKMGI